MLEIRWHSRAGQGAVTGAKGLADVVANTLGKQVQAFAFYGSAKRGASMTAYNRVNDKSDEPILNHEKFMNPDFVLVIDPGLTFITDICENEKSDTQYIITTHLSKDELLERKPQLKGKKVWILDCIKISLDELKKPIPNAPMLGALIKIAGIMPLKDFQEGFKKVLGKKMPQAIIDANMKAIERAYNEVQ